MPTLCALQLGALRCQLLMRKVKMVETDREGKTTCLNSNALALLRVKVVRVAKLIRLELELLALHFSCPSLLSGCGERLCGGKRSCKLACKVSVLAAGINGPRSAVT